MEPEGPLAPSQQLTTCPQSELDESRPRHPIQYPSTPIPSVWLSKLFWQTNTAVTVDWFADRTL